MFQDPLRFHEEPEATNALAILSWILNCALSSSPIKGSCDISIAAPSSEVSQGYRRETFFCVKTYSYLLETPRSDVIHSIWTSKKRDKLIFRIKPNKNHECSKCIFRVHLMNILVVFA